MTIRKVLMAAAVPALAAPATSAFAHDDDYSYSRHQRDHRAHWRVHRDISQAHRRAHEEGFYSRSEHRAYHRALRDLHGDFHGSHPGTRHDHAEWRRYWSQNHYGHGNPYRYRYRSSYEY